MGRVTKVLVANRGEIAVRIMRTLRALGIPSVAVYHAVDAHGLAVREAGEAVELQGAPPVSAYLDVTGLVEACRRGGKGMRLASDDRECRDGFARATREAQASFGDGRVFIERFIERPRHIEIQVLGDAHGNVIHLGERECSIQRRHQKLIEEAPSPFLDAGLRSAMGEKAVALARAVDYQSAGTVEFVVDSERNFYFLEMNTRLQVEHPVTELVTGLDIVAEQIRIARGEALGYGQDDIRLDGHAIECRLYAENADEGFLPAIGHLLLLRLPHGEAIRVDNGVLEGQDVTAAFDP